MKRRESLNALGCLLLACLILTGCSAEKRELREMDSIITKTLPTFKKGIGYNYFEQGGDQGGIHDVNVGEVNASSLTLISPSTDVYEAANAGKIIVAIYWLPKERKKGAVFSWQTGSWGSDWAAKYQEKTNLVQKFSQDAKAASNP